MKKVILAMLFTISWIIVTNTKEVMAEECNYEVSIVQTEEIDFENVKQVIETEMVYDVPKMMLLNDFEKIPFEKTMYLYVTAEDGVSHALCAVKLSGIYYYYTDGKVHLYSLNFTSYVYETNGIAEKVNSSIYNTDGSYSKGLVTFNYTSPDFGFFACEATVEFTKGSTTVNSGLDVLAHTLP